MDQRQGERLTPEGVEPDGDDALERRLRNLSFPTPPTGARERTWEKIESLLFDGCSAPHASDSER